MQHLKLLNDSYFTLLTNDTFTTLLQYVKLTGKCNLSSCKCFYCCTIILNTDEIKPFKFDLNLDRSAHTLTISTNYQILVFNQTDFTLVVSVFLEDKNRLIQSIKSIIAKPGQYKLYGLDLDIQYKCILINQNKLYIPCRCSVITLATQLITFIKGVDPCLIV